jgi:hypothetical protein
MQMASVDAWRELLMLTGTDGLTRDGTKSSWQFWLLNAYGIREEHGESDQYDETIQEFVPILLDVKEEKRPDGVHIHVLRLPSVEEALKLPAWLAYNEPELHSRLYAQTASPARMDLNTLLSTMDTVSANVERLQVIWNRAQPLLPTGPQGGSTEEYDNLVRAWDDLLQGLMPINGWTIVDSIPGMDEIGMMYLDYMEIGDPPFRVFEAKEQPQKDLDEYRYRLGRARRQAIRGRVQELITSIESVLPEMLRGVERNHNLALDDPRVALISEAISEIERLLGSAVERKGRWSDLHRHMRFGQGQDWHDIYDLDWPSVKKDIEASVFSESDPLPVPKGIDLGNVASSKPEGHASTELNWSIIDSGRFEHLLYDLARVLPGYQNVQLLMKTNAADRGRDISAERVYSDGAGGMRTERVMIQAKHWQSRSVPPEEISSGLTRIVLWEPPPIRNYIVATSGAFTPDAVAWVEKHNNSGKQPYIDLWPESRLSTLLSERPYLVAEYGLR